jgi:hypothetical protein
MIACPPPKIRPWFAPMKSVCAAIVNEIAFAGAAVDDSSQDANLPSRAITPGTAFGAHEARETVQEAFDGAGGHAPIWCRKATIFPK